MRVHAGTARIGITTLLAAGALLAAESCKEPTSIEIEVRTSLRPSEIRGTRFYVGGDASVVESDVRGGYASAETRTTDPGGLIGTLVTVPSNGQSGRVSLVVVAGVANGVESCGPQNGYQGCIVARRQLAYRENERLRVPILLEVSCVGVPCNTFSTCAKGGCFSSSIDCDDDGTCRGPENGGDQVAPDRPDDAGLVDGAVDGLVPDARVEAATDASSDAPRSDAPTDSGAPGYIACPPGADCRSVDQACCRNSGFGVCVTSMMTCVSPNVVLHCDGPEDCGGTPCCITPSGTDCAPSCPGGNQLCHSNGDCAAEKPSCAETYAAVYSSCK